MVNLSGLMLKGSEFHLGVCICLTKPISGNEIPIPAWMACVARKHDFGLKTLSTYQPDILKKTNLLAKLDLSWPPA